MRCELRMPIKDAPVIDAMKTLSAQYPRYGYPLRVLSRQDARW